MRVGAPPPSVRFAARHLPRFTGEESVVVLTREAGEGDRPAQPGGGGGASAPAVP
jgi:hypothetical protein